MTATERVLDALERRLWAWDLTVVYAGVLAVLVALAARIAEGWR